MFKSGNKLLIGIFFGGKSAEHEISCMSAKNILDALDKTKFTPVLIGIDRDGCWYLQDDKVPESDQPLQVVADDSSRIFVSPGKNELRCVSGQSTKIDVALPILHGPFGEDGTIQGLFELLDVPYAGPGVLGSAVGMDKEVMKRLLQNADIATAPYRSFTTSHKHNINADKIFSQLGKTVFVKPANMGSSIGVHKAQTPSELGIAIEAAFEYDTKIIIESAIVGAEIECSILGNQLPQASGVGQIIPRQGDFYSYEAKYIDENGAVLQIPAKIPDQVVQKARQIAIKTFEVLACEGMCRVDMFATADDGEVLVNEINTIPGFTKISMYPKLWEASGIPYSDLVTRLIDLAIERYKIKSKLIDHV
jgi:D-alanine-D-alanine ligase